MSDSFVCLLCRRTFVKTGIGWDEVCKRCDDMPTRRIPHRADPHPNDDADGYDGSWSNAVKTNEDRNQ